MSEFEKSKVEQGRAFSTENARQFLVWMFKRTPPEAISALDEAQLKTIHDILLEHIDERLQQATDARRKWLIQAPLDNTHRWFEGKSIKDIADAKGKQDGSIHIGLTLHAERLAEVEDFDTLVADADVRIAQEVSKAYQQGEVVAETIKQEEALPTAVAEPEPEAKPELHYDPKKFARPAMQKVKKQPVPAPEAKPDPKQLSGKELLDAYPLMSRIESKEDLEKLEDMLRKANIIK